MAAVVARLWPRRGGAVPAIVGVRQRDPWETAARNFPEVDDETGRLATQVLREFGVAALTRVRKPWDQIIALAVLRYAARQLRADLADLAAGFTRESTVEDIHVVHRYAEEDGLSPMLVGYNGFGRPVHQALRLFRDAQTLRDAVLAAAAEGGETHTAIWRRAVDLHAFAVVALDHRILLDLPLRETYELAAAAIRHAEASMRMPGSVDVPLLPPECGFVPAIVALHASACLPDRGRSSAVVTA
jgi:hypothetical protein